jgi:hypothetical protein
VIKKLFTVRSLLILLGVIALFVVSGCLGSMWFAGCPSLRSRSLHRFLRRHKLAAHEVDRYDPPDRGLLLAAPDAEEPGIRQRSGPGAANRPQNALEMVVEGFYGVARNIGGSWPRFFPSS